ncbi:hypothetical protein ACWKSP_39205 [Micromonosporaceae bacterium Da 78-11]
MLAQNRAVDRGSPATRAVRWNMKVSAPMSARSTRTITGSAAAGGSAAAAITAPVAATAPTGRSASTPRGKPHAIASSP